MCHALSIAMSQAEIGSKPMIEDLPPAGEVRVLRDDEGNNWLHSDDLTISLHYACDIFLKDWKQQLSRDPEVSEEELKMTSSIISKIVEDIVRMIQEITTKPEDKKVPNT